MPILKKCVLKLKMMKIFVLNFLLFMLAGMLFSQEKRQLFNEKNLNNYEIVLSDESKKVGEVFYIDTDGVLNITGFPNGYMRTKEKFKEFELNLEWRWVSEPANSGVLLGITGVDKVWPDCVEAQLQHDNAGNIVFINSGAKTLINAIFKENKPEINLGNRWSVNNLIFSITRIEDSSEKPVGEWNHYKIILKNEKLEYYVNGVLQNTANLIFEEGFIGLQSEGGHIQFRNIYIL